jgi:hypothetical protein
MVGDIIPLRRATSSRYDGRLEQESAVEVLGVLRIARFAALGGEIEEVPPRESASAAALTRLFSVWM